MVAAIFTHFYAPWCYMLAPDKIKEMDRKFRNGVLDQELLEKTRSPFADMKPNDFRFLKVLQQISLL
jgi:hypothetical protein